ncbi:hypothetical protein D9V29_09775 [Mycetocola manganoxydans]|uniref:Ig-like domain-containing protein n=1 Tax=Mycetocola manganoxydans TaxID=699879 RepID=A0A3L6ZSI0_9MICO|nr:hypothetical protein D9V29_09775 [Mycetocola manganoxydans]
MIASLTSTQDVHRIDVSMTSSPPPFPPSVSRPPSSPSVSPPPPPLPPSTIPSPRMTASPPSMPPSEQNPETLSCTSQAAAVAGSSAPPLISWIATASDTTPNRMRDSAMCRPLLPGVKKAHYRMSLRRQPRERSRAC